MLEIIAKSENMMSDWIEAKLPIERHRSRILLPDAEPNLISVSVPRNIQQLRHERLGDPFAMPPFIDVNALDFRRP